MTAPMSDAEIREALARAERATCGPWTCETSSRGPEGWFTIHGRHPKGDAILAQRSEWPGYVGPSEANGRLMAAARTDVPRLVATINELRTRAETAEARCRELEAERAIVADYLRDTDADFRARRPSERAVLDALLSPPPPHTCQIHRATSGASDCGLEPCEEAKAHTDRGASRPATVRRERPAPSQEARCAKLETRIESLKGWLDSITEHVNHGLEEAQSFARKALEEDEWHSSPPPPSPEARCGSRTKLRGSDGRPLCERHGGVRADFQQNDEPCIRVQPTPSPEATETWRDAIGCAPSPPGSISSEEAVRRVRDGETTPFEADTMTHEEAKCATCGGEGGVSRIEAVGHDEYGDLVGEAVSEPCPDCHGCGGAK